MHNNLWWLLSLCLQCCWWNWTCIKHGCIEYASYETTGYHMTWWSAALLKHKEMHRSCDHVCRTAGVPDRAALRSTCSSVMVSSRSVNPSRPLSFNQPEMSISTWASRVLSIKLTQLRPPGGGRWAFNSSLMKTEWSAGGQTLSLLSSVIHQTSRSWSRFPGNPCMNRFTSNAMH